jgi:ATP-dependent Clp protease adaptor protein ClpS
VLNKLLIECTYKLWLNLHNLTRDSHGASQFGTIVGLTGFEGMPKLTKWPNRDDRKEDGMKTLLQQYLFNAPHFGPVVRADARDKEEGEGQTLTQNRPQTKRPALYKVILLNDDFTPMDFVILILRRFFHKTEPEANRIMLEVHNQGAGLAGIFPFEVAETKVYQVSEFSRTHEHPLKCIMEKEDDNG